MVATFSCDHEYSHSLDFVGPVAKQSVAIMSLDAEVIISVS